MPKCSGKYQNISIIFNFSQFPWLNRYIFSIFNFEMMDNDEK